MNNKKIFEKIKWFIAILFIVAGIGAMVESVLAGLVYIIGGLFILPPTYNFFAEKTGLDLPSGAKWVIVIIVINIPPLIIQNLNNPENPSSLSNEKSQLKNSYNDESDIKIIKEYLSKEKRNLTDENGLRLMYKVDISTDNIINLASSDKNKNIAPSKDDDLSSSLSLHLSVRICSFSLSLNGNHQKEIRRIAQVFTLKYLDIFGKYTTKDYYYFPDIDDISKRKKILELVTDFSLIVQSVVPKEYTNMLASQGLDVKSSKFSYEWANISTELIKKSNILQYNSLEDI